MLDLSVFVHVSVSLRGRFRSRDGQCIYICVYIYIYICVYIISLTTTQQNEGLKKPWERRLYYRAPNICHRSCLYIHVHTYT